MPRVRDAQGASATQTLRAPRGGSRSPDTGGDLDVVDVPALEATAAVTPDVEAERARCHPRLTPALERSTWEVPHEPPILPPSVPVKPSSPAIGLVLVYASVSVVGLLKV